MINKVPLFEINKPNIENKNIIQENNIEENKKSVKNGIISEYKPNEIYDRYVLTEDNVIYKCKFYNKEDDEFIGKSLLDMYKLNEKFDRSILNKKEDDIC